MAQGPSDTILVAIRITLWIRESKVRNPDRRRFVLCECILVTKRILLHDVFTENTIRFPMKQSKMPEHLTHIGATYGSVHTSALFNAVSLWTRSNSLQ